MTCRTISELACAIRYSFVVTATIIFGSFFLPHFFPIVFAMYRAHGMSDSHIRRLWSCAWIFGSLFYLLITPLFGAMLASHVADSCKATVTIFFKKAENIQESQELTNQILLGGTGKFLFVTNPEDVDMSLILAFPGRQHGGSVISLDSIQRIRTEPARRRSSIRCVFV